MKNFLVNLWKALCYLMLYLLAQVIASYGVILFSVFHTVLKEGAGLTASAAGVQTLIRDSMDLALSNVNLILLISAFITILVLVVFFRARGKRLTRETWLLPVRPASLWPVFLLGIGLAVTLSYAVTLIPWPQSVIDAYEESYAMTEGGNVVIGVITTVLAAPILEELIFRGLVFTRLCRGMPAPAAVILAATLFAALHGTILWAAYAFAGGIAMTLIYMKYRSLAASILLHMTFNLFGGYLLGLLSLSSPAGDYTVFGAGLALTAGMALLIFRMPREKIDRPIRYGEGGVL